MATPNPNGRIEAGQPIAQAFSARAWNRAQDAADIVLGTGQSFAAPGASLSGAPYSWLYLKNSGPDVERGMAVAITGVQSVKYELPVVTGDAPSSSPDKRRRDRYAITLEPIASGAIGRAAIAGVVHAKINMTTDVYQNFKKYARPTVAGFARLEPSVNGPFEILAWETNDIGNPEYGDNVAVVRFDNSGAELRLCKTSTWFYKENPAPTIVGSEIPLHEPDADETTINVRNMFADVAPDKYVMAARASDGYWYAIAAECG